MRIIILKFGGTSVGTVDGREQVAFHVNRSRIEGYTPVVVVSAMGREGDPYATDTLLRLARQECPGLAARELDIIAACGEIIAAVVVAGALQGQGLTASVFTGAQAGIITDGQFADARILRVEPVRLQDCLNSGTVAVVAGFQGMCESGETTTLGRGGSDTTAAALASALRAELLEIYTDVDGVKTADPRLVPCARTIDVMGYDEVAQLAYEGARVVHPRAIEVARRNAIPIRIRNTFSDAVGTLVCHPSITVPSWSATKDDRVITGVTHAARLAQVTAVMDDPDGEREVLMFSRLADEGISIDLINLSPEKKVFCVLEEDAVRAVALIESMDVQASVVSGCGKVSIVGAGMRGLPGVMMRVVRALSNAGVKILQTADSHVTISCLVPGDQLSVAARALHDEFDL